MSIIDKFPKSYSHIRKKLLRNLVAIKISVLFNKTLARKMLSKYGDFKLQYGVFIH